MGVHIHGRICLKGGHVLLEDISYRRKCLTGGLNGGYVLLEGISYMKTCAAKEHLSEKHMLWKDMSYGRICFTERHILQEDIF